jgi:hypothetical protein
MPLPDLIEIIPLDKPVGAEITVPARRASLIGPHPRGTHDGNTLEGALWADTQVMTSAGQLRFEIKVEPTLRCNRRITVKGWFRKFRTRGRQKTLCLWECGTAARFLAALVCLGDAYIGSPACRECTSAHRRFARRCASLAAVDWRNKCRR